MSVTDILKAAAADYKINLGDEALEKFETYSRLLTEWNEKINLTAITDEWGMAIKHFTDSLSLLNFVELPQNAKVIDVGTGAGFPGMALKIARPDIKLTLLDSLNKRLNFLSEVLRAVNLSAELLHGRAEECGKSSEYRETFDMAASRAVARLNVLCEYCLPFVKPGGVFAAMKGADADDEIAQAENAVELLGGKIETINKFKLPNGAGERCVVVIKKISPTPSAYPRISKKNKIRSALRYATKKDKLIKILPIYGNKN